MLRHNFILIYRNIKRFKTTFFINLIGLSTGLACTLLIYLWVNDELQVDTFHSHDDQLFQIMVNHNQSSGIVTGETTQVLLGSVLAEEMPEIKYAVGSSEESEGILSVIDKHVNARGKFVGRDYFTIFSYPLIHGESDQVLSDKKSIVLSEELAIKLFKSTENALGKTVEWELQQGQNQGVVTGVFKNVGTNSSQQFDFLLTYEMFKDVLGRYVNWGSYNAINYLMLGKDTDIKAFNEKISDFLVEKNQDLTLFVKPYSEKYLYGKYENGKQSGGRIEYINLFSIIAICLLFIACINFMNLSTAKATRRVKEIGIKKAIGARRWTLIFQYLGESLFMSFLSLMLAIFIVDLLLPQFNLITGKRVVLTFQTDMVLFFLGVAVVTGIIAGSYPAIFLSGFSPAAVLKGKLNSSMRELLARKGLVIIQFTCSIIFIISVIVIYEQVEFIQNKHLGYQKENILYFKMDERIAGHLETMLTEIKSISGVKNASSLAHNLTGSWGATWGASWEGKDPESTISFEKFYVYYDLIETLGIEMKSGRTFSRAVASDTASVIINETGLEAMELKDPIGKIFKLGQRNMEIIGIAKDFHFESLHEEVKPLFIQVLPKVTDKIMIRIEAGREKEVIQKLQTLYQSVNAGFPFHYEFLDSDYQRQYAAEERVSLLSRYFAGLAIIISCLGLFGLALFNVERRQKEIGIRKALGSTEIEIVRLLSSDFTKMVLIAIAIALPLSYVLMRSWLDSFAFRTEMQWWYFLSAGLMALLIAWITVGLQTVKAAKINPSVCLKDE
ncbi:MAG TPA: FtsX-like permease family protein [Ohtaekwangia sp.]|nr:FtsX-like permease family protein [Ohtaekwangia sp.]